MRMHTN